MTTCDRPKPWRAGAVTAAAVLLAATPARAQAEDQAAARALFTEGRNLAKAGQYDRACPKFEAASKLYAGSGVLLNLADCYEHTHRTASAWTEFGEAQAAAARSGRPADEAEARRRQAALEPRLSRLSIHVANAAPGLTVKRDGRPLDPAAWDEAIPVDPGAHVVTAEAPGRSPWSMSIDVSEQPKTVTADVPELAAIETATPATAAPSGGTDTAATTASSAAASLDDPHRGNAQRAVGWAAIGIGAVGLGVGGILGLVAKSQYTKAEGEAQPGRLTDSQRAVNAGNAATVVVAVGGAVAAAGIVVWLTAPHARVAVGTNGSEVVFRGAF
jgi:hypothetical protein